MVLDYCLYFTLYFVLFLLSKENPYDLFPESLKYTKHHLIPPILILPEPGWLLLDRRVDEAEERDLVPELSWEGVHGYDPSVSMEMRTIFYARGPAFKKGVTVEPFESVNVYPLMAHLLGIKPRPNNGSLSVFKQVLREWNPSLESSEDNATAGSFSLLLTVCVVSVLVLVIYVMATQNAGTKASFRVKKSI